MKFFTNKQFEARRKSYINSFIKEFIPAYKDHAEKWSFVNDELGGIETKISKIHKSDDTLNADFFEVRKIMVKKIGRTFVDAIKIYCNGNQDKQQKIFEFCAQLQAMYDLRSLIFTKYQRKYDISNIQLPVNSTQLNSPVKNKAEKKSSPYTDARKVLSLYYLIEAATKSNDSITFGRDKTEIARFMDFITSEKPYDGDIRYSNVYKKIKPLYGTPENASTKDLLYIESQFEKLGLSEIVRLIQKELTKKRKKK